MASGDASPAVGDITGDGKDDLIVGAKNGEVVLFANSGTSSAPVFARTPTRVLVAAAALNSSVPTLGDLDGDGDLDMLVGAADGSVSCFANDGAGAGVAFAPMSTCGELLELAGQAPARISAASGMSAPTLADLSSNGGGASPALLLCSGSGSLVHYANAGNGTDPRFGASTPRSVAAAYGSCVAHVRSGVAGETTRVLLGGSDGALQSFEARATSRRRLALELHAPASDTADAFDLRALRGASFGGIGIRQTLAINPSSVNTVALRTTLVTALQPLLPASHQLDLWSTAASATTAGATEVTMTVRAALGATASDLKTSASRVACGLAGGASGAGFGASVEAELESLKALVLPSAGGLRQVMHDGNERSVSCVASMLGSPPPPPEPMPPSTPPRGPGEDPASYVPKPPPPPKLPVSDLWLREDGATQSVMLQGALATGAVLATLILTLITLRLCLGGIRGLARRRLARRRRRKNRNAIGGGGPKASDSRRLEAGGLAGSDAANADADSDADAVSNEDEDDDAEATVVDSKARVSLLVKLWTGTTETDGRRVAMPLIYELVRPPVSGVGIGGRGDHEHASNGAGGVDAPTPAASAGG